MEALLYLVGLSSYLNPELEQSRHTLFHQLREKLHATSTVVPVKQKKFSVDRFNQKRAEEELICLAENPSTAPYLLAKLADHVNPEVRIALADNPNAPHSVHRMLSTDENADVRFRMAENYHTRRDLLILLMNDENPYVCVRAEKTLTRLG